jgi:hypothetical protein
MVAYDAILRAAGRPSTFRTGLAAVTGPRWYGVRFLLPAYLTPQQEPWDPSPHSTQPWRGLHQTLDAGPGDARRTSDLKGLQ